MRKSLRTLFMATLAVLPEVLNSASAADLTVGAYGGAWEEGFRDCVVAPFEKATGKKVDIVVGSPVQWENQIAANPTHPPLDLIMVPMDVAHDAVVRKLVDPLDKARLPHLAELAPRFVEIGEGYGAVMNYGAAGVLTNTDVVKTPPASWKEFSEGVIAGKYKASIPSINYAGWGAAMTVWWFAHIYGGDVNNIDPGMKQIRRMLDSGNLIFWSDPNQFLNQLQGGDADIGVYWDGRSWPFINGGHENFAFTIPAPGALAAMTLAMKVKGSSDLVWDLMDVAFSPAPQVCFATKIRYGVSNMKVVYPPAVAPQITPIEKLVFPPSTEIPSKLPSWVESWNREISR